MKIVRTSLFERSLKKLGASATDLERLEAEIAAHPTVGDVIQGLSGARKARFSMAGRGKSGGGRAIYVLAVQAGATYLLLAYSKKEQEDLSTQSAGGGREGVDRWLRQSLAFPRRTRISVVI